MVYPVNPADPTSPLDSYPAGAGAAEFRALKGYIQGLLPGSLTGANFFRKNLVINGDFAIDQRNEGAASAALGIAATYSADRFVAYAAALATVTIQQITGFASVLTVDSLRYHITAATAPVAADISGIETALEGVDVSHLFWGTAGALPISISFVAAGPIAGNYTLSLRNAARNRCYIVPFALAAANVPQYITINNIPGDITGVWTTDTTQGLNIFLDLGSGSNYESVTQGAWQAGNFVRSATTAKAVSTVGDFFLANLQVEQGVAATIFERRKFRERLEDCMRYYWKSFPIGVKPAQNAGVTEALYTYMLQAGGAGAVIQINSALQVPLRITAPTFVTYNPSAANANLRNITAGADSPSITSTVVSTKTISILANSSRTNVSDVYAVHATANADFW